MIVTVRELCFLAIIVLLTVSFFGIAMIYEQRIKEAQQPCTNISEEQFLFCTYIDNNSWLATIKNQNNPIQTAEWVKDFCEKTIGCEIGGS